MPEVTEIFLPGRLYKESDFEWVASSGGRIQLDWERERVWIWFVDVPRPYEKPRPDRIRRVDFWVSSKVKPKQTSTRSFATLTVLAAGVLLAIALGLQNWQWERDRQFDEQLRERNLRYVAERG